jgi:hypothetical protein
LDRELEVLVESPAPQAGVVLGTSCRYAPVELDGDTRDVGTFVRATAACLADKHIAARRHVSGA